jgi:hypothetical protein
VRLDPVRLFKIYGPWRGPDGKELGFILGSADFMRREEDNE